MSEHDTEYWVSRIMSVLVIVWMTFERFSAWRAARERQQLKGAVEDVHNAVISSTTQIVPQILLVDDDQNDLVQMSHVLKKFGAEIYTCGNADDARNLIQSRVGSGHGLPFHVAIVDLRLQISEAGDIIALFEEIAPWVPVAIITGMVRPDLLERAAKISPPLLLNKPLEEIMAEKLLRKLHIPFSKKD